MNTIKNTTRIFIASASAVLMAGAFLLGCGGGERQQINGAGGSFPAPLYQAWCFDYSQDISHPKVNYQSVGSSAGISQIKAGTVDFAGTDAPLSRRTARSRASVSSTWSRVQSCQRSTSPRSRTRT